MKPFDAHLHFEAYKINEQERIINEAKSLISGAIVPGTYPKANRIILKLASKHKGFLWPALSVHPVYLPKMSDSQVEDELKFISKQNIVAIGEAGLDYFWLKRVLAENIDLEKERQIRFFRKQIELADQMNIPIIIHSRWASARVLKILEELRPKKALLHGFEGTLEQAERAIKMGYYISNGPKIPNWFKDISIKRILLETDAPYKRLNNRSVKPKDILLAVEQLASIKNLHKEKVIEQINNNVKKLFNIDF